MIWVRRFFAVILAVILLAVLVGAVVLRTAKRATDPEFIKAELVKVDVYGFVYKFIGELAQKEAIFAGVSSGAVIAAAQQVAREMRHGTIVVLLADGGWKYLSTQLWTRPLEEIEPRVQTQPWW